MESRSSLYCGEADSSNSSVGALGLYCGGAADSSKATAAPGLLRGGGGERAPRAFTLGDRPRLPANRFSLLALLDRLALRDRKVSVIFESLVLGLAPWLPASRSDNTVIPAVVVVG